MQSSPPSFKAVLQRKVCIVSPGKIRKSPKKYLWSNAEDLATVQFTALHKDQQASDQEWPAMRAEAEYWSEAAQYIQSATGTKYLRKGMYKYNGELETKMQIIYIY